MNTFPLEAIKPKEAAKLAQHYQEIADRLRGIAEKHKPLSATQQETQSHAKRLKDAAWQVLRLEANGLDTENAILATAEKAGLPIWILTSAAQSHRSAYLAHHRPSRNRAINRMIDDGYSQTEVADRFGLSQPTICRIAGKEWTRPKLPKISYSGTLEEREKSG